MIENSNHKESKYYVRILSPRGVYPDESVFFDDAAYVKGRDISFSVCRCNKNQKDYENKSYSEVEWLKPTEARLYGSLMLAVDRDVSYCAFYPYPHLEMLTYNSDMPYRTWLLKAVKPYLQRKYSDPDVLHPGYSLPERNLYRWSFDILPPPMFGGPDYEFRDHGIDYKLSKNIFCNINTHDDLMIRGITTLIKSAMLHFHYQFFESAIHSLFISMEVSFRLVVRTLKEKGILEPTSKDAMAYIHDSFNDVYRIEHYFEEYYENRVTTFHPESRFGIFPHAPLQADDYYFLFNDLLEIYAFLICGYIHPKYNNL
ncbi:MAG: hypothetical protein GKS00_17775 [Alphaproteobacteria bacterium]|nr:hypothetical protein [Alphaproteobacteria bacterium]